MTLPVRISDSRTIFGTEVAALGRVTFRTQFFTTFLNYLVGSRDFASWSLRNEIDRLRDERLLPLLLFMFAFWIVCAVEWTQKVAGTAPDPRFWTLLSLIVTVYGGVQVFRLHGRLSHVGTGKQANQKVLEILDRIRSKGFVAFHGLAGHSRNIDHVVVGPTGVYTIEAKARSGSGTIDYRSDDELVFAGRIKDGRPLHQARSSARAVQTRLNENLDESYRVKALVVFLGNWRVHREREDFSVEVTTADQLEDYFDTQPPELTSKEIAQICSRLDVWREANLFTQSLRRLLPPCASDLLL
jgi:hypothetical protein